MIINYKNVKAKVKHFRKLTKQIFASISQNQTNSPHNQTT